MYLIADDDDDDDIMLSQLYVMYVIYNLTKVLFDSPPPLPLPSHSPSLYAY